MLNYSHWDLLEEIKLEEAVCLWCGIEPRNSPRARRDQHPESVPVERFLLSAIKSGELPSKSTLMWQLSVRQKGLPDDDGATVDKADLRKLAEQKGARPRFLFPDGKATGIASTDTIPTPTDKEGRRIIAVLDKALELQKELETESHRAIASAMTENRPGQQFKDLSFSAVRKILDGNYQAATLRGVGGLDTWSLKKK